MPSSSASTACTLHYYQLKAALLEDNLPALRSLLQQYDTVHTIPHSTLYSGDDSTTAVHCVQSVEALKLLQTYNVPLTTLRNTYGQSILHTVVTAAADDGSAKHQHLVSYVCSLFSSAAQHSSSEHWLLALRDNHQRTALHNVRCTAIADCILQQLSTADQQLQLLSAQDANGTTLYHTLATNPQYLPMLQHLCSAYSSQPLHINDYQHEKLPLHVAASHCGEPQMLQYIVEQMHVQDTVSSCTDLRGWSALFYACVGRYPHYESQLQNIELLLHIYHVDVNHHRDAKGMTALHIVSDSSACNLMLQHSARALQQRASASHPNNDIIDVWQRDNDGRLAVHLLAHESTQAIVKYLKSTWKLRHQHAKTALDTLEAEIEAMLTATDKHGRVPLHTATDPDKVHIVIAHTADKCHVNVIDNAGRTPLDYAMQTDRPAVVEVLKQYNAQASREMRRCPVPKSASTSRGLQLCLVTASVVLGVLIARAKLRLQDR